MKQLLLSSVFVLAFVFDASVGQAQNYPTNPLALENLNTITTSVPFLRIAPDSRSGGMGEGGIALDADANSMHWNISRLAFAKHRYGISASYTPWLRTLVPDINLFYAGLFFKPDSNSAITGSFGYFSLGSITYTNSTGIPIGQFSPREYAADLGYTRKLGKFFSIGLAFRYAYSNLADFVVLSRPIHKGSGRAYCGDLGFTFRSNQIGSHNLKCVLTTGIAITNVGTKIYYYHPDTADFIPINLGVAQALRVMYKEKHVFTLHLQLDKLLVPTPPIYEIDPATGAPRIVNGMAVIVYGKDPNRSVIDGMLGSFNDAPGGRREELREVNVNFGLEYDYNSTFKVRAGYFYEHANKGNRQFITLGAGVGFKVLELDLAYIILTNGSRSPLENTVRFSLLCNIDKFNVAPKTKR